MLDQMNEQKFTIGEVEFSITKLSAMDGWRLLEDIRHQIGKSDLGDSVEADILKQISKTITGMDPAFVDDVRERLFKKVEFKTKDVKAGWLPLSGGEDMAFEKLEPSAIYELLMRCLVVNFTASFSDILSRLKGAKLTLT